MSFSRSPGHPNQRLAVACVNLALVHCDVKAIVFHEKDDYHKSDIAGVNGDGMFSTTPPFQVHAAPPAAAIAAANSFRISTSVSIFLY